MKQRRSILGVIFVVMMVGLAHANTIYVTPGASDSGDTWSTPTSLANALTICTAADEIWLAEGTYTNNATFTVGADRTVYGGFTNGMTTRAERDWTAYPTILDGQAANRRVVTVSGANVLLDGLVITNSSGAVAGGITKAVAGSLTLANCRIVGHAGTSYMRGMGCAFTAGSVLVTNCVVAGNTVSAFFGNGFGIYSSGANLELVDCQITNNWTTADRGTVGAGLYFNAGTLRVQRTDFIDNRGRGNDDGGGGVYLGGTVAASFSNCVLRGNEVLGSSRANAKGGGIWLNTSAASTTRVVNCTFTDNFNGYGHGGAVYLGGGTLVLKNSILWSNAVASGYTGREIYLAGGTLNASYCDLTGLTSPHVVGATLPANCQATDPLFAGASDLHLQSKMGRWESGTGFVLTDTGYSPCIDAGDPTDPVGGEVAENGSIINQGAYGGTTQASKSPPNASPLLENQGAVTNWNRAVMSGALTNESYVTATVGLCYGTNSVVADTTNGWEYVSVFGTPQHTGTVFSVSTPVLLSSTTYYFRWYATNMYGENWTPEDTFVTGGIPPSGGANVIHVSCFAAGAADGSDWVNAYPSLTDGINVIAGTRTNLWITGGTYDEGTLVTLSQSATLIGGFAGTETAVSERALTNALGVVTNYAIIDGEGTHACLAITAGNVAMSEVVIANGRSVLAGAFAKSGIGNLTMSNCRIEDNVSAVAGVGCSFTAGSVLMTNCVVSHNAASTMFVQGIGIYASGTILEMVDCLITDSYSTSTGNRGCKGFGLYFANGTLKALRTDFIDNEGYGNNGGGGGGVCMEGTVAASFSNCLLRGNKVFGTSFGVGYGGGLRVNSTAASTTRVVNCTFTDNMIQYGDGGAIHIGGGALILKNSILWTNTVASGYSGSEIFLAGGTLDAAYCNLTGLGSPHVMGTSLSASCQASDPLFAGATDVHLQSPAGRWEPAAGNFVTTDPAYSPCIDAGDPSDSVGDELTDNGNSRVNMGRYGGTAEASKSPPAYAPLLKDHGSSVNYDRAKISGELTNNAFTTAQITLCYGTSNVPGDTTNGWDGVKSVGEKNNGVVFSTWTPALTPSTTHYYRWYAVNNDGSHWTAVASFDTGVAALGGEADVLHVNRLATGAEDGSDWAHAYTKIGDAIMALAGTRTNIWITGGTYNEGTLVTLSQGATLVGGFVGTETAVSERALTNALGVVTNYAIINGEGLHTCLAITAGDVWMECLVLSNSYGSAAGGGIAKAGSGALTMSNCRIVNHTGTGGSMTGIGGSFTGGSVLMTNCLVANNTVTFYFSNGLGIYSSGAHLEVVDCLFSNNSAVASQGTRGATGLGLYFNNGVLSALRTDFIDNKGPANGQGACGGAGVYLGPSASTSAAFSNCVFRGNEVLDVNWQGDVSYGGAMWANLGAAATARVVNCTFTDNAIQRGDGGAIYLSGGTLILKNSILWSNEVAVGYTGSEIYRNGGTLIADHCDLTDFESPYVVGDVTLTNCISVDPLFASATDVHLQSRRGRWNPATSTWVTDRETSPCIDAGDPADSVGLEPLPHGKIINLGAYGGTARASLTYRPLGTILLIK